MPRTSLTLAPSQPTPQKLLIISCSAAKRRRPAARTPAIERYDGVFFKVLRKALRQGHPRWPIAILIISAKYGLITPDTLIPNYDIEMNARQAEKLASSIRAKLQQIISHTKPREILINLGQTYAKTIRDLPELQNASWVAGPIGKRASILKAWLTHDN
jgi:cytoplasmic iron level regulating protein YaaA (DUF328/UPF0246 family)